MSLPEQAMPIPIYLSGVAPSSAKKGLNIGDQPRKRGFRALVDVPETTQESVNLIDLYTTIRSVQTLGKEKIYIVDLLHR